MKLNLEVEKVIFMLSLDDETRNEFTKRFKDSTHVFTNLVVAATWEHVMGQRLEKAISRAESARRNGAKGGRPRLAKKQSV